MSESRELIVGLLSCGAVVLAIVGCFVARDAARAERRPESARAVRRALRIVAPLPGVWLSCFGTLLLVARLDAGRWPQFEPVTAEHVFGGKPWPLQSDAFSALYLVGAWLFLPAVFSVCAYVPLAWSARRNAEPTSSRMHVGFAGSFLALCALFWFDPGGVVRWWID
jgi:hypothetical protein